MLNDELLQELLTRAVGRTAEEVRLLIEVKVILQKQLLNLIKLNAAMNKLNYISGVSPKISNEELEKEMNLHDAYLEELKNRLSGKALDYKKEE